MVDSKLYSYPGLHALIGMCKTNKFATEVDKVVRANLKKLYEEKMRVGQLMDNCMNRFGFCLTTNYAGGYVSHVSECEAW